MQISDECFAIFQGGGAKGITHLGALKALDLVGLSTIGAGGTSAGAIIAALVAVGYKPDELFDPSRERDILSDHGLTPISLLGAADWRTFGRFQTAKDDRGKVRLDSKLKLGVLLLVGSILPPLIPFTFFNWALIAGRPALFRTLWRVVERLGFFSTEGARDILNDLLRDKLATSGTKSVPDLVCFRDLDPRTRPTCCRLKIIATNVGDGSVKLFDDTTPDVVVADAVAASFSIPLFFKPSRVRRVDGSGRISVSEDLFADGGLVSNLPVWSCSEDKRAIERVQKYSKRRPLPTIAFTLEPPSATQAATHAARSPVAALFTYMQDVARAGVFGGQSVIEKFVPHLTVVGMRSPLGVVQFDCTREQAAAAYKIGLDASLEQLQRVFRANPFAREELLAGLVAVARRESDRVRSGRIDLVKQFRASVVRQLGNRSFKVIASYNMDDDSDDDLVLDRNNPGAPKAFEERDFIHVDCRAAGLDLRMTKYERALLRQSLSSVIAIPIFEDPDQWTIPAASRTDPVGVFCLDSDSDLQPELADQAFLQTLAIDAVGLSGFMKFERESDD